MSVSNKGPMYSCSLQAAFLSTRSVSTFKVLGFQALASFRDLGLGIVTKFANLIKYFSLSIKLITLIPENYRKGLVG